MFKLSGDGLLVNYRFAHCGLCNRHYDARKKNFKVTKAFESMKLENSNLKIFGCGHHFHEKCLVKWNNENGHNERRAENLENPELWCPTCFKELKVEDSKIV